jgi:hypothetical protein
MQKSAASKPRKILIILSNRFNRSQRLRYIELAADNQGNVLKEGRLRGRPAKPSFDEVWENDDGKSEWTECKGFRRRYPHPLEKA